MWRVAGTDSAMVAFTAAAVAYFGFLAFDYLVLRLDSVAFGVVAELLTIPMILAVAVVCLLSAVRLARNRRLANVCNVGATAALFVLNVLIWAV